MLFYYYCCSFIFPGVCLFWFIYVLRVIAPIIGDAPDLISCFGSNDVNYSFYIDLRVTLFLSPVGMTDVSWVKPENVIL